MDKTFIEFHQTFNIRLVIWKDEVLFSWQWWLGVVLTIIPWILWFMFRNKQSTDRLLYAGIFVALASTTLDNIGFQLGGWNYLKPVIPFIPAYVPFDFSLMPIFIMFLIQYFPRVNPLIIGLCFGFFTAYIAEPIFEWIDIYKPVRWKYIYSLPIYTIIYLVAHRLAFRKSFKELPNLKK